MSCASEVMIVNPELGVYKRLVERKFPKLQCLGVGFQGAAYSPLLKSQACFLTVLKNLAGKGQTRGVWGLYGRTSAQ
jgi:hypothetical protein